MVSLKQNCVVVQKRRLVLVEGWCGLAGKDSYYLASPAQKTTLSLKNKRLTTGNVI